MHVMSLIMLCGIACGDDARAGEGGAARLRPLISLRFPGIQWLETEQLAERLTGGPDAAIVLLDARTQPEFGVSHLAGASRVDPDSDGLDPGHLPRETPIVVYCSIGYRSAAVARRLAAAGFERVYNLEGGIFQWANEGRPVCRDGERVGKVHPYDPTWGRLLDSHLQPER